MVGQQAALYATITQKAKQNTKMFQREAAMRSQRVRCSHVCHEADLLFYYIQCSPCLEANRCRGTAAVQR